MGITELFMSYDKWFNHHNINEKRYGDSTTRMLYRDRWFIWLSPIIIGVVGVFVVLAFIDALTK